MQRMQSIEQRRTRVRAAACAAPGDMIIGAHQQRALGCEAALSGPEALHICRTFVGIEAHRAQRIPLGFRHGGCSGNPSLTFISSDEQGLSHVADQIMR